MIVKLLTAVSGLDGSWGTGIHDLPDKLAAELVAGGLAETTGEDAKAKKPRAAKEQI